jgi:competence protein CoiA
MLVAVRKSDGVRVEGRDAERGPEYACPDPRCGRLIYLKKPLLRVHHFAHGPGAKCVTSNRETPEHIRGKDFLLMGTRSRGLKAEVEVPLEILDSEEDRRADVLVWSPKGHKQIAFELQHTVVQLKDIIRRTRGYIVGKFPVVWINLIKPRRIADSYSVSGTNLKIVSKYTTHAWERWAHDFGDEGGTFTKITRGHLWFLDPRDGQMWRGWMWGHYLYREGNDYYDASGDQHSHASYWYPSERYRTLILEGPFKVADLRIKPHERYERKRGAFQYPFGPAAWLLAPTDDNDGPRRPLLRMHQETLANGVELQPRLQICCDGVWINVERRSKRLDDSDNQLSFSASEMPT